SDNFIGICCSYTDHALEIDGPEGTLLAGHTLRNGSVKGSSAAEMGDFRDGAYGIFERIYFFGFPDPAGEGRGDISLSGDKTLAAFAAGNLSFNSLEATLAAGVTVDATFKSALSPFVMLVNDKANTVGADKSVFANWTWSSVANQLNDFK